MKKRPFINETIKNMQPSGIRAFFDLVLGMKDVISLGVGEPDFVTPWQIRESGIYSLEQGFTSYTSNKGLVKLRLAIADYLKNRHGLHYCHEEEMLVTVGVSEGMDLGIRSMIGPGDKVLIPYPCYVSYAPMTEMAGGTPVMIDTSASGFKLTPDLIEKHSDKKTKAIILNYPSNPTGVSYSRNELMAINRMLLKKHIFCISDEIYGELTYDFEHTSFPSLPGARENTLYLDGFSKAFAMTGWRIGFACGPADLIAAMTKIHQYTIMCVSITSQMAACEALVCAKKPVEEMKREYKRRREYVVEELNRMGLDCVKPQGAFYAFPSIKRTGLKSIDFSKRLLEEQKVAVVPGSAFGPHGDSYIRISYASSFEKLKEAMSRISRFIHKL